MAFIGMDGLERELRQLKSQLGAKDHELSSIRNEHNKSQAELQEARRAKDDAEYKLQAEVNRAHQAESSLAARAAELANFKLQYANFETSLRSSNEKLKLSEKECQRLQYDLEATNQGQSRSVDASSSSIQKLEKQLKARDEEIQILRSKLASSAPKSPGGPLKRSATAMFPPSFTPARSKSRRRSASFSSDPRVTDLQAELEALRSAQGSSSLDLDKIRAQLEMTRKELDKATNAKLALEKTSRRELEQVKSDLEDAQYELEGWRRNDEGSSQAEAIKWKNALKERQTEVEDLQEKLESSEARAKKIEEEIAVLRAQAESSEADPLKPQSPDAPDRSDRQYKRQIKTLESRIQTLEDELEVQDEEILRLKSAVPLPDSSVSRASHDAAIKKLEDCLRDLEAQLDESQRELGAQKQSSVPLSQELEDNKKEMELSIFGLQQERDAAKEEVTKLEEQVDMLETNAATAEAALEALKQSSSTDAAAKLDKITEAHGQVEALRTELNEVRDELQNALSTAESMQEKYEEAARERIKLEEEVSQLQATLADRSTESEAQGRVAEVFDHKETIQHLTQQLEDAKTAGQRVTDAEDNLRRAERRIQHLEQVIAKSTPLPSMSSGESGLSRQVELLQDKIQRLRSERDELRLNLSFLQHEHRFAHDAAVADRLSALEDLDKTRSELHARVDAITSLESEHGKAKAELDSLTSRLEGVTGDYAAASAEKHDLADKISQLEIDLRTANSSKNELTARTTELEQRLSTQLEEPQIQDLINDRAIALSRASKAEMEHVKLRKDVRDLEDLVDQLRTAQRADVEKVERPPSRSDRPSSRASIGSVAPGQGHIRRLSGTYTADTVDSLKIERADLLGRIQRRQLRIEGLQNEVRQLKANLHLAREAAEDHEEEKKEVERELCALQQTHEELKASLQDTKPDATQDQATIRELVVALAVHQRYASDTRRTWKAQKADFEETNATLDRITADATGAMEGAKEHIRRLSGSVESSEQLVQSLRDDLLEKEKAMEAIRGDNLNIQAASARQEKEMKELKAKLAEAEEKLEATSTRLSEAEVQGQQSSTDMERHVGDLAEAQRAKEDLESRLDGLVKELALSKEARDNLEREMTELTGELDEARQRIKEMEGELEAKEDAVTTLSDQLEKGKAEHAQQDGRERGLTADLEQIRTELANTQAELESSQKAHEQAIAELEARLAEVQQERKPETPETVDSEELAALTERVAELEAALTTKVQEVDEADDRVREAFKAKTKLEKKVAKLQRHLAAATTDQETAANTAANKSIPPPPPEESARPHSSSKAQPPSATTPRSKSMSSLTSTGRPPLRSVNIFATAETQNQTLAEIQTSPGNGLKRHRDEEAEKKLPADLIIVSPGSAKGARSPGKGLTKSPGKALGVSGTRRERARLSFRAPGPRGPL